MSQHKRDEMAGHFAEEPLLKDNPGRFVLFPIQDAEVSIGGAMVHLYDRLHSRHVRFGKCTRRPKPPSGPPKKSIWPPISMTGTASPPMNGILSPTYWPSSPPRTES